MAAIFVQSSAFSTKRAQWPPDHVRLELSEPAWRASRGAVSPARRAAVLPIAVGGDGGSDSSCWPAGLLSPSSPRATELESHRSAPPAAGTGGFLVEAYKHLHEQVKTIADRTLLQERSVFGAEPKPLPYLLCQMNLLLHGLDSPQIDPGNSLRFKLSDIGEKDRVDVILTNPPFGGEEEKGIQGNFPEDKQTAETALLFLELIMRRLHRQPTAAGRPARAAVVVPNGTLFGDGVCSRIKAELLKEFNLHTVVRLPNGVFAPYTSIPTNLLFFDRSGPTREVWYYEHALPAGRKNYTKTAPVQFEEFAALIAWWGQREETEWAWKIPAAELLATGGNLDRKNPRAKDDITHLPPEQLAASILEKEQRIAAIMGRIRELLEKRP